MLLSDEATSALDPETTRSILQLLRDLNQELGLTVLLITHEMDVVKTVCDSAALMKKGRIVESGTVGELLATPGSELAHELFPVGGAPSGPGRTVVDVTFHGEAAAQPVISQLSRTYNIDISILGAAMDTVGGKQIGRMRIELPGRFEENVVPIGFLREQGLQAEVVGRQPRRHHRHPLPDPRRDHQGGGEVTWSEMQPLLTQGTIDTLYMVLWSTLVTVVGGLPLGILLVLTDKGGLLQNTAVNKVVGVIVNIGRSLPFIILLIALIPFTTWVVGTFIGPTAMIVPLAIGAIPFFARLVETAVREVDHGLVEAVQSMGGSIPTIVRKVLLPQALPSLVSGVTTTVIVLIGYSAMAGAVGGEGLGSKAVTYGFQRFDDQFMLITVALLIVIVTVVQLIGDVAVRLLARRGRTTT